MLLYEGGLGLNEHYPCPLTTQSFQGGDFVPTLTTHSF